MVVAAGKPASTEERARQNRAMTTTRRIYKRGYSPSSSRLIHMNVQSDLDRAKEINEERQKAMNSEERKEFEKEVVASRDDAKSDGPIEEGEAE